MASGGFSRKTGKKYGFVAASDIKIGAVRGANMHSQSLRMPMNSVGYVRSWSPGMTRAGESDWGGMMPSGMAVNEAITGKVRRIQQMRANQWEGERADAMQQHPSSAPAATVGPADSYYRAPSGGMGAGRPEALEPMTPTLSDYVAPTGMGAKVPASRTKKF